jgi:hypothetical protein
LVVGEKALDDMNHALALAKRVADAEPLNPVAITIMGAAQYRAGRSRQAIVTLTKALSQLGSGAPAAAGQSDLLVCRLIGETILALAYHQQTDGEALQKQRESLEKLIARAEKSAPQPQAGLPAWTVGFAVEIAKRELAKLRLEKS